MSIRCMNAVWETDFGNATKKLVMLSLADNANDQGQCWPGLDSIAKRSGLHRVTVSRAIKDLISGGFLSHVPGSGRKSSRYALHVNRSGSGELQQTAPKERQAGSGALQQEQGHAVGSGSGALQQDGRSGSGALTQGKRSANAGLAERYRSGSGALTKPSGTTIEPPLNQSTDDLDRSDKGRSGGSKTDDAEMISRIYQAYPRKVGKPAAIKAIIKAIRQHPARLVLERTTAYAKAREGQDENFTPHPSTWFNQERFLDDPSTWAKVDSEKGGDRDWGW